MTLYRRGSWLAIVSMSAVPLVAGCDSEGAGVQRVTIRYTGDASAYGVFIHAAAAEPAAIAVRTTAASCTLSDAAAAAGCRSGIATDAAEVRLKLDECFVETGDALFDCELSPELAQALRSDATVHAGCGCEACPSAPAIAVCESGQLECPAGRPGVNTSRSKPDVVATSQRGTGETACSTCCETDYFEDEIGSAESDEVLSEIAFDVTFADECAFDFNGAAECDLHDDVYEEWSVRRFSDGRLVKRFCFAGRAAAQDALSVSLVSCRGLIDGITVTRALGPDFMPLASVPTIRFE